MIFFYEMLFVAVALAAAFIGEAWTRTGAALFLLIWLALVWLGYASFQARLGAEPALADEDARWYADARDGLRHLRLLLGIALVVAVAWRAMAG